MKIINLLLISSLFTFNLYAEKAVEAEKAINATVSEIVAVVKANSGDDKKQIRRDKIREVIEPKFDFEEMAKRSLGASWRDISKEEQDEFVRVFSDLLSKTYLNKVETLEEGMVTIASSSLKSPKALVKTKVKFNDSTFPLDYKLLNRDNAWKVYDVIIENIGLIVNYRNEFAGIIRKEEFSGLMKKLKEKLEK